MTEVRISSWSNVLATRTSILECDDSELKGLGGLKGPLIPRGSGRSYGDAAYITGGVTLSSGKMRRILEFDAEKGTIVCESGVGMVDLLNYLDESEWTFPVAGGTQWVTIGGAVAADIHGKNDTMHGSFGNHVVSIHVILSDGQELQCSKAVYPDLYAATIGGMGLTGFIKRVQLRLQKAKSSVVQMRTKPFSNFEEMHECFERTNSDLQVAWVDLTRGSLRGIYHYACYVEGRANDIYKPIEIMLPTVKLFGGGFVRALNAVRYAHQIRINKMTHVRNFHYPVDVLKHWNKLYGPRGFHEFQFVVPAEYLHVACGEFMRSCRRFSVSPFFAVVKKFGTVEREGLLSFPKAGFTLTADFETRTENELFFNYFTDLLLELEGRIYLAKDSYMVRRQFEGMYEHLQLWRQITRRYDPGNKMRSDLSIRLGMKPW